MNARIALIVVLLAGTAFADELQPLFDGESIDGWKLRNGTASYVVEDGVLVGTTAKGSPNSFLSPPRDYSDFILEFETLCDPVLNSGVQIRTDVHKEDTTTLYMSGRLELVSRSFIAGQIFGYQIEIDTSPRAWTAGLYEVGRRGWLQTLEYNEPARKAFKQNEWNKLRIQAVGDSVKTWLNGISAADTRDAWCRSGRIGFQLHGSKETGKQMRFRGIRIQEID